MAQLTQFAHAHEEKERLRQQTIANRRRMDEGDVEAARLVNGTSRLQQTQTSTTRTKTVSKSLTIPPTQKPTSFEKYFSMRAQENAKRFEAEQQFTSLLASRERIENCRLETDQIMKKIELLERKLDTMRRNQETNVPLFVTLSDRVEALYKKL